MKKISFVVITLIVLLSACSGNSVSLEGEWKLISYGDAVNPTPALPDVETSINFGADGQFGGSVGCNSFGAGYKVDGDQVIFESIMSTLMFCEGVSDQETVVLNILSEQTLDFTMNGNQVTLTSLVGSSVIVLERK